MRMSRRLKIGCGIFLVVAVAAIVIPLKFMRVKPIEVDIEKEIGRAHV